MNEPLKHKQGAAKESAASSSLKKSQTQKKVFSILFKAMMLTLLAGLLAMWWIVMDAPRFDPELLASRQSSLIIASDLETVIAEVGPERRYNVELDQLPQVLVDAVLATEDVNFYDHFGIDLPRTAMSLYQTFIRGNTQGGSTITQQLTRNVFLTLDQTPVRKIQEWYLSIQMEWALSKDEILELYFNRILYGGNIFGIGKAAERFFGLAPHELDQLTLEQAALLAGIPQSPNRFNPVIEDNHQRAENRRNTVLYLMNRHGKISEDVMLAAQATPIADTLNIQPAPLSRFQAFVDTVIAEVQEKTVLNIFEDGLRIYTTLDPKIQELTESVLQTNDFVVFPDNDRLESAVVITDTQTGAVRAIGGGRDYQAAGFNNATMSRLQPGSTIKPIFYGANVEYLHWPTDQLITDQPTEFEGGQPLRNYSRTYVGTRTLRDHLAWSRNTPALYAYRAVGAPQAVGFARRLGIPISEEQAAFESNAVGTMSTANPMNMAPAYAAFGNGGYYIEPFTVYYIAKPNGEIQVLWSVRERVMADSTAYLMTDMLRTAVYGGTGQRANVWGLDLAGKTGSTTFAPETRERLGLPADATRDSWFIGFTPQLTGAVWTGFSTTETSDDYLRNANDSTRLPQHIFREIFSRLELSTERFSRPETVGQRGRELYVRDHPSSGSYYTPSYPPYYHDPGYGEGNDYDDYYHTPDYDDGHDYNGGGYGDQNYYPDYYDPYLPYDPPYEEGPEEGQYPEYTPQPESGPDTGPGGGDPDPGYGQQEEYRSPAAAYGGGEYE